MSSVANDTDVKNTQNLAETAIREGYRLRTNRKESNERDLLLLAGISNKDEDALVRLYDKYQRSIYSILVRIVRDEEEAQELLQDVFLQVWEKAALFDKERGNFDTWLFTLAHNKAINTMRSRLFKKRKQEDRSWENDLADLITPATTETRTPLAERIEEDDRRVMLGALQKIPQEQREAIALAYYEGLSQSEIAEELGIPLGTIKTRMRQGMIKLRSLVEEIRS